MTTSRTSTPPARERGRPRAFDMDTALDNAMIVFRQKGFHASSVADLSEAMNLTAGSIYKAFKDKRTLFLRVFERYISLRGTDLRARLQPLPSGRARIAELLQFYLDSAREIEGRRGCLVVGSTVELQSLDEELSDLVRQAVLRNRNFLLSLIREGQEDGSVSAALDAETAAGLLLCVAFGMRVVGKVQDVTNGAETINMLLGILD
ncbi:MAG: TetR/AcrR family transcriptional regulator [Pantoea piersonii]|uniref:TetR/AcrR family transcriptional regulator n=2 Tax=Erwiniaceae TaxID=1903409 RepID=A0AAJ5QHJ4_9GAMM|nr:MULTISPECIES: TetR/AcrR family transcriptional regulator [Pantoea]MDU6431880.1 TetR/AcrR family transcriptional regulator [Pantoea sp.]MBZ6387525.1 TetR/AcrR family transcriptional regulator [Pantoea piersonii]MBZ6402058.1 TetR/AcrR family transcriptional regulator [Pantoea piersonii]MBZ6408798.1 TetR/AcrR family transcriptional regulator [Pantoea piersonii]MBZ6428864.1 TetR/AcrR family transcriptional regulator [Pantoea piersonii]